MFRSRLVQWSVTTCSIPVLLFAAQAYAHTVSVGYENAGPGAVTFWYGTYHNTAFTEGSMQLTDGGSYNTTTGFTLLTQTKPTGLVDGTTNFFSNPGGTALVGTYTDSGGPIITWQGVTISGLTPGTYTFTYIPIAMPSQDWDPRNTVIRTGSVTLTAQLLGGGFVDNSSSSSHSAAGVLDDLNGTATGALGNSISTLSGLSADDQHAALQHVPPQTGQALGAASTQPVSGSLDSVSVRLDNIRTQGYTSALADRLNRGEEIQVASNGDMAGLFSSDTAHKHTFWTKAFGAYGTEAMSDGFAGYRAKTGGMAFGGDTLLDNNWVIGLAGTYATTDIAMHAYRSGDSANIDSYQATAYGSRNYGKWYVEGMAAYARQNFTTVRNDGIGGIANGDFDGSQYAARLTAGMPVPLKNKWIMTPSAGLEFNYLEEQGYDETGTSGMLMHVNGVDATRLRSVLDSKFASEYQYGSYKLEPSVHVGWRHEFSNSGIDSTSTFTGGGAAFTTPGQSLTRNTYALGTALTVSQSRDFSLAIQLDTEQALHYSGYAGQILAQWKF